MSELKKKMQSLIICMDNIFKVNYLIVIAEATRGAPSSIYIISDALLQ